MLRLVKLIFGLFSATTAQTILCEMSLVHSGVADTVEPWSVPAAILWP
jgi:hypothetical protein